MLCFLQFAVEEYVSEMEALLQSSKEEVVQALRRGSSCFARWEAGPAADTSLRVGVTQHHNI
jgi:hypothetical protein